jgi:hypothetical protein
MKPIILLLLVVLAQSMEIEQTQSAPVIRSVIVINNTEVIKLLQALSTKPNVDDPIKAMGTGGNSGGNTPTSISYKIIGDDKKVMIEFYGMFEYAMVGDDWKLLTQDEQKLLMEYVRNLKWGQ